MAADVTALREQVAELKRQIAAQEALRGTIPEATLDLLLGLLRQQLASYQAQLVGSGAQALGDHNVVGGKGAMIITGTVGGDVRVGVPSAEHDASKSLREQYLSLLLSQAGRVDLASIDPAVIAEEGRGAPRLESIYTSLRVKVSDAADLERGLGSPRERELLPALALVNRHPRLVLLGDPGSGKSTFVRFLAVCLAGQLLGGGEPNLHTLRQPLPDDKGEPKGNPQPWDAPVLLPVLVVLRDFAATGLPTGKAKGTAQHLWSFLEEKLETEGLRDFFPALRAELGEKGGFVLLDGLDEVPQANERRRHLLEVIDAFAGSLPRCRVAVTSRTYAYQDGRWRLPGFEVGELAPFDEGQVRRFVRLWYEDAGCRGAVKAEVAPGRAEALLGAIFRSPHIRELAERPLLLTLMASLHAFGGRELPERREELYEKTVELLLYRWEKQRRVETAKGEEWQPSLSDWLETSRGAIRTVLEELAFGAHRGQAELVGTADVPEDKLLSGLMALRRQGKDNPGELLDYLRDRAGILLPRGVGVFTFPHRSFQEYLAACHLAASSKYPDELAELTRADPERWREVTLLAAARAAANTPGPLWDLVDALCGQDPPCPESFAPEAWGAHIGAQAMVERGELGATPERHWPKVERLRRWLVHLVEGSFLPAQERALAGRSLAALGDPREGVTSLDAMEYCWVPAGPFLMGSREGEEGSFSDERPQHELDLNYGYWMARYPLTGAQWREFVEASGVTVGDADSLRVVANVPVAWVSWREALACCQWLTSRWRASGLLPAGWSVRLPSEAEWEKAARGGLELLAEPRVARLGAIPWNTRLEPSRPNPEPQRTYPWCSQPGSELANYSASGIGQPSAVGAFAQGRSECGCEEMSGNVWEWTRSTFGGYPYVAEKRENLQAGDSVARVLRGGSYVDDPGYLRCASRVGGSPGDRYLSVGFRVMLSPFSSDL